MGRLRRFAEKHDVFIPLCIALLTAFMYVSGIPFALFLDIRIADVAPVYLSLMINMLFAGSLCVSLTKALYKDWPFRLRRKGILRGLGLYGAPGLLAFLISLMSFHFGLMPYDNTPTALRVLLEIFLYYSGVALIEELFMRGLLLNIFRRLLEKKRRGFLLAVLASSVIFGLGHLPGMLGVPPLVALCKLVWTIGLGIYLSVVYIRSDNLWCAVILHAVIDFAALPYCFSTTTDFPVIALVALPITYTVLGALGIAMLPKAPLQATQG